MKHISKDSRNLNLAVLAHGDLRISANEDVLAGASLESNNKTILKMIGNAKNILREDEKKFLEIVRTIEAESKPFINFWKGLDTEDYNCKYNWMGKLKELENKYIRFKVEHKRHIDSAQKKREDTETKKRIFQRDNNLIREAKYPDSKTFYLALTSLLILIETGLNAEGHRGNGALIEGIYLAFGISFTNVLLSLLLGRGFTLKNLKQKLFLKICGWSSLLMFISSSIFLNGFYATYRSELLVTQVEPQLVTIITKTLNIFLLEYPISDMKSHLTFIMTLIFSLGAFIEGYYWSDPCPGYEEVDKNVIEAREAEEELIKKHEDTLKQMQEEILSIYKQEMSKFLEFPILAVDEIVKKLENVKQDSVLFREAVINELDNSVNKYVQFYFDLKGVAQVNVNQIVSYNDIDYTLLHESIESAKISLINLKESTTNVFRQVRRDLENNEANFLIKSNALIGMSFESGEINEVSTFIQASLSKDTKSTESLNH
jgi:hypothetical protein